MRQKTKWKIMFILNKFPSKREESFWPEFWSFPAGREKEMIKLVGIGRLVGGTER